MPAPAPARRPFYEGKLPAKENASQAVVLVRKAEEQLGDLTRPLPSSQEAEKGVLSAMVQNPNEIIPQALLRLKADAFHIPAHKKIFELLLEMNDKGKAVDAITIVSELSDRHMLESVGGPVAIAELETFTQTPAHFGWYAEIVAEKSLLRRLIGTCSECITRAYDDQEDVTGLLDTAEQKILAVREDMEQKGGTPRFADQVAAALDEFEDRVRNPGVIRGFRTGYSVLDGMTTGLQGGDVFVIAARPSMGKTSLAMNIVEYAALDSKLPVAVFSLEMSAKVLVQRLLACRANLSLAKLKQGFLGQGDQARLMHAVAELSEANILIDDTPALSIMEMRAKARRLKNQHGIQLIVIDYLQLLRSTSRRAQENRQIEIAEISAGIKAVAKELDLPVIVLAQLNRNVEGRKGGRPMLSDLRESGSIEQDADVVGLLTRSDYAGAQSGLDDQADEEIAKRKGDALLIIAKHRNGPTGDVPLNFLDHAMRFTSRELPAEQPPP